MNYKNAVREIGNDLWSSSQRSAGFQVGKVVQFCTIWPLLHSSYNCPSFFLSLSHSLSLSLSFFLSFFLSRVPTHRVGHVSTLIKPKLSLYLSPSLSPSLSISEKNRKRCYQAAHLHPREMSQYSVLCLIRIYLAPPLSQIHSILNALYFSFVSTYFYSTTRTTLLSLSLSLSLSRSLNPCCTTLVYYFLQQKVTVKAKFSTTVTLSFVVRLKSLSLSGVLSFLTSLPTTYLVYKYSVEFCRFSLVLIFILY